MTVTIDTVWQEFHDRLRQFISRRINDPFDVDDVLQEVFIKIHQKIDTLNDDERMASWVYRITRNAIVDHYRRHKPQSELPPTLMADEPTEEPLPLVDCLRPIVESLPDKYRQALIFTEFDGFSQRDLAAQLGLSHSGAKSRVQRARQQVQKRLRDCCAIEQDRRGGIIDYRPRQDGCQGC